MTQYQKDKQPSLKKWAEDMNRHFAKEQMQMAKKQMKRCSILLTVRVMLIKTMRDISSHYQNGYHQRVYKY